MAKPAPTPVDVLDFQFKLRYRLKVFQNEQNDVFAETCSLIASASRFGLLFVGTYSPCFQVLQLQSLDKYTPKDGDVTDFIRRTISLASRPKHLAVNCDCTKLCVVIEKDDCASAIVYDVTSFLKQNINVLQEIRLSPSPGVAVVEICWNPGIPNILSVCKTNGSLGLYELKETGVEINELPPTTGAACMCWSPKGKQIAVGSIDGKITQYKPDLKLAKVIKAPVLEGAPSAVALQWVSNYQFIAVYKSINPDVQLNLLVVDAPKTGDTVYTNYEDICYSYGTTRPHQFYLLLQPVWNILMVASSNSMELGVLAFEKDHWIQWILTDSARAELPLSSTKQDTLPIGMAFDTSSTQPYPWGEATLHPMPLVFLLSHHGTLCCFNAVNLKKDAASVCHSPEKLTDISGVSQFTKAEVVATKPIAVNPIKQINAPVPTSNQIFTPPPVTQTTLKPAQSHNRNSSASINSNTQASVNLKNVSQEQKSLSINEVPVTPQKLNQTQPTDVSVLSEDTEMLIAQMVKDECSTLEIELVTLLQRGRGLKIDLGSDSEATSLVQSTNDLEDFANEATETSSSQAAEVHSLRQSLIQTWVWYEEVRSRFATFKDPKLMALMHAQPLDPASERQLADIRHLFYYIESQLNQANVSLDEQWESFQDSCKKKLHLRMPSIETIYQLMVKQNATLQKQLYILKDLSNRVRRKHRDFKIPQLLVSLENVDNLEEQLKNLSFQPSNIFHLQHERLLKRQKLLTKVKTEKLTNLLVNRKITRVSVSKPQLNTSLQLSSLIGEPFSPIVASKKLQPQKLNFVQSTPKVFMKPEPKTQSVSLVSSTSSEQLPKSQVFNINKPVSVFAWTSAVPDASKASAFVPTAQAVSVSIKPSNDNLFSFNSNKLTTTITTTTEQQKFVFSFNTLTSTSISTSTSVATTNSTAIFNVPVSSSSTDEQKTFVFKSSMPPSTFSFQTLAADANVKTSSSLTGFNFSANQDQSVLKAPTKTSSAPALSVPVTTNKSIPITSSEASESTTVKLPAISSASAPVVTTAAGEIIVLKPPQASKVTAPTKFGLGGEVSITPVTTFSLQLSKPETVATTTTKASLFGNSTFPNTAASSILAKLSGISTSTSKPVLGDSIASAFITPKSNASVFGSAPTIFGLTTTTLPTTSVTSSSIFAATTPTLAGTPTALATTAAPTSTSVVSTPVTSVTVTHSLSTLVFGTLPSSTTYSTSIFATPATSTSTSGASTTSSTLIFGTPISSTSAFGTSTPSAFGTPTTSVFGVSSPSATILNVPTAYTSVFGTPTTSTSIFGTPITSAPSAFGTPTSTSVFGTPTTSVPSAFGTPTATTVFGTPTTSAPSAFGTPTATTVFGTPTTSAPSTFGTPATSTSVFGTPTSAPSAFGTPTTSTSVFGTTTTSTPSAFGTLTTATSVFATTTTSAPSAFGTPTTAATVFGTPTTSAFGTPTTLAFGTSTTSTTLAFGTPPTTSVPAFGSLTTSTFGASAPVFGTTSTTTSSVFGASTTSNIFSVSTTPSVFGTPTSSVFSTSNFGAPTTSASVFGAPTTSSSVFGGAPSSIFGGFKPATTSSSVFGQPATFVSGSIFSTPAQTTSSSIFGNTSTSVFGNPVTSSAFGTPTVSASFGTPNVFGNPTTGTVGGPFKSSGSIFGSTQANSFSFANAAANSDNNTSSSFGFNKQSFGFDGTPSSTDSGNFNFGSLSVCSPTTTGSSFGGSTFGQSQNIFGRTSTEEPKSSPFGGGNQFGTTAVTSSSIFGGTSPFNKQSAFANNSTTTFGGSSQGFLQQPTFGQSSFGSGNVFGGSQPGPFSGGNQSVSQTGFGASTAFAKPSGFGNPPPFGSTSPGGFGAPPTFGGTPAFGSAPTFGSPGKVFGSSGTADAFSPSGQQNATFANLASQPTLGFGSLAQQSPTPSTQPSAFSGSSSFSTWR